MLLIATLVVLQQKARRSVKWIGKYVYSFILDEKKDTLSIEQKKKEADMLAYSQKVHYNGNGSLFCGPTRDLATKKKVKRGKPESPDGRYGLYSRKPGIVSWKVAVVK